MTSAGKPERTGRVLVVEDDESTALFVTTVLGREGLNAAWVVDAEQAKALLADESYDVLLADYRLPGRSGMQLAADVHRLIPEMRIAVMTSFAGSDMEKAARSSGADDFFEKPLHCANFVARMTELVRQSRPTGGRPIGAPPAGAPAPAVPVVTVPGDSSVDEALELSQVAESGPGEQAPVRGGAFAWRVTDRTSGSGGPLGEGTGGVSRARCSAMLRYSGRGASGYHAEASAVPGRPPELTERDLRARAWHPAAWRRHMSRPPFLMWASAAPAVSVGSAVCAMTSPQMHTSPS
jgi:DNA-binding response OmpR family regulator